MAMADDLDAEVWFIRRNMAFDDVVWRSLQSDSHDIRMNRLGVDAAVNQNCRVYPLCAKPREVGTGT
ncbi:hypothetical protein D9M71_776640 [compost metagenome]